jgi:hypothetical protein
MAADGRDSRARPTRDQELLLDVAFGPADAVLARWRTWRAQNDLDSVDSGTKRLLPLVYRRLSHLEFEDADTGRLKGLYRHTWYRNQVRFHWAAGAAEVLREAGVEVMLLKGAALSTVHYRDGGLRPMDDVDVLVRTERAPAALEALARAGWLPQTALPQNAFLAVRHAEELVGAEGARIDLHWNALWQPGRDDALWEAAVDTRIIGTPVKAPCATDELLLACVHGAAWNPVPPVRWAADALAVLAAANGSLDWARLAGLARARRVTVEVAAALDYLRRRFAAGIPASVVGELRARRPRLHERIGYRAELAPPSPLRTLVVVWDRYRRLQDLDTPFARPRSLADYAAATWGFDERRQLVAHAARRLAAYAAGERRHAG